MHKYSAFAYFLLLAISFFFVIGILRIEGSAVFFTHGRAPSVLPLQTERGVLSLPLTESPYFSFWFINPIYTETFPEPRALSGTITVPVRVTAPFAYGGPEAHVLAIMELRDANDTIYYCDLMQVPGANALLDDFCLLKDTTKKDIRRDSVRVKAFRIIFAIPTSFAEKITIFRQSARALIP